MYVYKIARRRALWGHWLSLKPLALSKKQLDSQKTSSIVRQRGLKLESENDDGLGYYVERRKNVSRPNHIQMSFWFAKVKEKKTKKAKIHNYDHVWCSITDFWHENISQSEPKMDGKIKE